VPAVRGTEVTVPAMKPCAADLIAGSSLAVAEPVVGAAAAVSFSTRMLLNLSVNNVACPTCVIAQPSGTLIEYAWSAGAYGTNAWLSGISPGGGVSVAFGLGPPPVPVVAAFAVPVACDAAGEPDDPLQAAVTNKTGTQAATSPTRRRR
jgi:hypothetical protein